MNICTILVVYFDLIEKKTVKEIEEKIENYKNKLNEIQNEYKFNRRTFFVVFDNMKMKDILCNFFPNSYFSKIIWRIRYFWKCNMPKMHEKRKERYFKT